MPIFKIHESNIDRLEKKLTRIRNKCAKFGCEFVYERIGEEFVTNYANTPNERIDKYIVVEAAGTAIVNGWQFAGTIQHLESGNIIRSAIDVEIPSRYYTCGPECEHCHSRRHRKETYIVYNQETEEFKQVGSSCLCDFTGGLSAEGVAGYIELFDELIQGEAPCEGWSVKYYYEVPNVLDYAFKVVDVLGFTSTSNAYEYGMTSTRSRVEDLYYLRYYPTKLHPKERERVSEFVSEHHINLDQDVIDPRVELATKWVEDSEEDNNYMHNLKVLVKEQYIDYSQLGFVVSIVAGYNREVEKIAYRKRQEAANAKLAAESQYQGKVGDRIVINVDTYKCVSSYESMYGWNYLYQILDKDGNVYMWSTSNSLDEEEEGCKLASVTGTVKEHKEYRGIKQTWVTRCRVKFANTVA